MILTRCAACAKPLAYDAPRCVRCHTRYCDAACQHEHWANGHKKKCKKIARSGGAEQYHADKKAKEAAEAAVVACAAEGVPQDAECFICKCSIDGQGIVSGCACHGGMGLAHVACLVRQAEMSVKEKEEWGTGEGMKKWQKCFDCGQEFHGAVALALGWACWKTYLGRPEKNGYRCDSLGVLGAGLLRMSQPEEALSVLEANLALIRRYWPHNDDAILIAQTSLANCLGHLKRVDEALVLEREVYARRLAISGVSHENTIASGCNLVISMIVMKFFNEARSLLRDQLLPAARQAVGADSHLTLMLKRNLAVTLHDSPNRTRDDLLEAETIMQDVVQRRRRVFGPAHPDTRFAERLLSDCAHATRPRVDSA